MNDSDSDSDDNDHQLHDDDDDDDNTEVEVEVETAAAASERRRLMLLKVVSVLQRKVTYPTRTIKKIDHLVDDFLENLEEDVWDMLCSNDADANSYQGLDNNIDTEAEVEAIIRIFPNVLSTRKAIFYGEDDVIDRYLYYPIQLLAFTMHENNSLWINLKAASFIPVVARLAIEFGCFDDELRGGLLWHGTFPPDDANVLQNLMNGDSGDIIIEDHHRAAMDNQYLQIFIRLRQMGLFKKEDIQRHELLIELVSKDYHFEEKRLRFLVEWDPSALLQPNSNGYLPIHFAAVSIRKLQLVFEYGIRYYPKKTGICLLFKKVDDDVTPFQEACERHGCDRVRNAIKDTLRDCQRRRSEEDNSNSTS